MHIGFAEVRLADLLGGVVVFDLGDGYRLICYIYLEIDFQHLIINQK